MIDGSMFFKRVKRYSYNNTNNTLYHSIVLDLGLQIDVVFVTITSHHRESNLVLGHYGRKVDGASHVLAYINFLNKMISPLTESVVGTK